MIEGERLSWLRLARTEGIGPVTFHRLLSRYGTATRAISRLPALLRGRPLVLAPTGQIEAEIRALEKLGGRMLFAGSPSYPLSLGAIEDAPPVLSVLGNTDVLQRESIAFVGSRNASLNGRRFCAKLAGEVSRRGYVVTSGLARGIDTSAHEGALAQGTVAVLAGGVDVVYPRENAELYAKIIAGGGAVLSECPLGMQPIAQHFPKRNRIISGLSLGVVVVEASLHSGSLVTARLAGEQGRDVMAVPGFPLDPRSEGTNALLREGAVLIQSADDILDHVTSFCRTRPDLLPPPPPTLFDGADAEYEGENDQGGDQEAYNRVLREISGTPTAIDEIVRACHLKSAIVQRTLLEMELSGVVQRLPGNRVCLLGGEKVA